MKPETDAAKIFTSNIKDAEELRNIGFGTVQSFNKDGIARGTSVCVTLNAEDGDNAVMVKDKATACFSLDKGSSKQDYPSSTMGAIALLRQTNYDAEWYRNEKDKKNLTLRLKLGMVIYHCHKFLKRPISGMWYKQIN